MHQAVKDAYLRCLEWAVTCKQPPSKVEAFKSSLQQIARVRKDLDVQKVITALESEGLFKVDSLTNSIQYRSSS